MSRMNFKLKLIISSIVIQFIIKKILINKNILNLYQTINNKLSLILMINNNLKNKLIQIIN